MTTDHSPDERSDVYRILEEAVPPVSDLPRALVDALIDGRDMKPAQARGALNLELNVDWPSIIEAAKVAISFILPALEIWKGIKAVTDSSPSKQDLLEALKSDPVTRQIIGKLKPQEVQRIVDRISSL